MTDRPSAPQPVARWLPIETAPANTWILTLGDWQDPPIGVSRYEDLVRVVERVEHESTNAKGRRRVVQEEELKEREWQGHHWEPTHWMPLPAPPGEEQPLFEQATLDAAVAAARAEERERCAKLCEQTDEHGEGPDCWDWHSKDYAKAIRGLKPEGE